MNNTNMDCSSWDEENSENYFSASENGNLNENDEYRNKKRFPSKATLTMGNHSVRWPDVITSNSTGSPIVDVHSTNYQHYQGPLVGQVKDHSIDPTKCYSSPEQHDAAQKDLFHRHGCYNNKLHATAFAAIDYSNYSSKVRAARRQEYASEDDNDKENILCAKYSPHQENMATHVRSIAEEQQHSAIDYSNHWNKFTDTQDQETNKQGGVNKENIDVNYLSDQTMYLSSEPCRIAPFNRRVILRPVKYQKSLQEDSSDDENNNENDTQKINVGANYLPNQCVDLTIISNVAVPLEKRSMDHSAIDPASSSAVSLPTVDNSNFWNKIRDAFNQRNNILSDTSIEDNDNNYPPPNQGKDLSIRAGVIAPVEKQSNCRQDIDQQLPPDGLYLRLLENIRKLQFTTSIPVPMADTSNYGNKVAATDNHASRSENDTANNFITANHLHCQRVEPFIHPCEIIPAKEFRSKKKVSVKNARFVANQHK